MVNHAPFRALCLSRGAFGTSRSAACVNHGILKTIIVKEEKYESDHVIEFR